MFGRDNRLQVLLPPFLPVFAGAAAAAVAARDGAACDLFRFVDSGLFETLAAVVHGDVVDSGAVRDINLAA